jgi:HK97 family phage prohead protease
MKAPLNNVCRYASFEMREAQDDTDGLTLEGYAAVFDSPTRIDSWEGNFDEIIERGAFAKTIAERMPVMQFDHGRDVATGSVPIGVIESLAEDEHGLKVRARLHDNARVEPIRQAIASGAIDGMSFRFRVNRESWADKDKPVPTRTIREVDLFEVGPVVFPAYAATSVGVRSMLADLDDAERTQLVRDLAAELAPNVVTWGAVPEATERTTDLPDAGQQATSDIPAVADLPVTTAPPSTPASRRQMARQIEAFHLGCRK